MAACPLSVVDSTWPVRWLALLTSFKGTQEPRRGGGGGGVCVCGGVGPAHTDP